MPELAPHAGARQADGDGHAAECAACAARLAQQRRLMGGLRALAGELGDTAAPHRVEAALLAAFRATHARSQIRRAIWWKAPALPFAAAGLAAAALAFGVWVAPKRQVPAAPAARHASSAKVELAALNGSESDDGFIALPNAPQIDPNDDVNVVRMELPRSAMLAVGLEVSPEQVSGTVEAEVMLGSDGLARAVRFME
jgi:anti-sigma factor RsiW